MDSFVSLKLMAHPINWITIFLWVMIIAYVIHMFHPRLNEAYPANKQGNKTP